MKLIRVLFILSCSLLGFACLTGVYGTATAADDPVVGQNSAQSKAKDVERIDFISWRRYYGQPVYRCRRFSYQCYYGWTVVYYTEFWSFGHQIQVERSGGDTLPARLGRYYTGPPTARLRDSTQLKKTNEHPDGARAVSVLRHSGGFTRITAPHNVTRWVRMDTASFPDG